jgi:hypothetical protein
MPYRTFIDSTNTEWQIWDIVPRLSERRSGEHDRRIERNPIPFADRRRDTRRIAETRRAILRGTYALGWLCFESNKEKRRLSPIPDDWTICEDERLDVYVRRAETVTGVHRFLSDYSAEEPLADAG